MSDITTTIRLNDQASSTLNRIGNAARQTSSQMTSAGRAIDKAFETKSAGKFASSVQSTIANVVSQLSGLDSSLGNATASVEDFQREFTKGFTSGFAKGFADEVGDAFDDMVDGMEDAADAADECGDAIKKAGDSGDGFRKLGDEAQHAGTEVDGLKNKSESLHGVLGKLATFIAGLAIANKIKQYGEDSLKVFESYETGMAQVATLMPDASEQTMKALGDGAREISKETGATIEQVTQAMYQAISASVPEDEVLGFLRTAEKAATGGVTDMETAVDAITSVINAYGTENLSAAEASDKMFTAVRYGKTTFGELAGALYNVVPTAVGAGVAFDDVTGALAAMTAQGVPTSVATTQLRQAIVELSDSGGNTGKKFKELAGVGFREFIASGHNLSDAFQIMQAEAEKTGVGVNELFSSVEAGNAVLSLSGDHASLFAEDISRMQDSAGATEAAYEKMDATFADNVEDMKAKFEDVKLEAGQALAEGFTPGIEALGDSVEDVREPVVSFFREVGETAADLAPLLPGVIRALTTGLSAIGNVLKPIFSFVADNPEAVGTALAAIATGIMTFKVGNALSSIGGITGALSSLFGVIASNPWVAAATAAVAGITMLTSAYKNFESQQMNANLDMHFGDIELSGEDARTVAMNILNPGEREAIENNMDVLTKLEEANDVVAEAREIQERADQALKENNTITWVAHIEGGLSDEDKARFLANVETFISETRQSVLTQAQGVETAVQTLIGGETGATLVGAIDSWTTEDLGTMDNLSEAIRQIAQDAIDNGLQDVNINTALAIAQAKLQQFNAGLRQSQLKASLDYLTISQSGAALDQESWAKVVEEMSGYQKDYDVASEESEKSILQYFEQAAALGHVDENGVFEGTNWTMDDITRMVGEAREQRGQNFQLLAQDWVNKSLKEAYGSDIMAGNMFGAFDDSYKQIMSYVTDQSVDKSRFMDVLGLNATGLGKNLDSDTRSAISDRYGLIKDNVMEMQGVIDQARAAGEAVPEAYYNAYKEAIRIGAAAGDEEAGYAYMAERLAGSGKMTDFLNALEENGKLDMLPDAFREAINREIDTLTSSEDWSGFDEIFMKGVTGEVDWNEVEKELNAHGLSLGEGFKESVGEGAQMNASEAAKYLNIEGLKQASAGADKEGNVEFTTTEMQPTVWSIADRISQQNGQNVAEISKAIMDANEFSPGMANAGGEMQLSLGSTIKIPAQYVMETEGAAEAGEEAGKQAAEEAGKAAEEAAQANPAEVTTESNVKKTVNVTGETTDAGTVVQQAAENVQSAASESTIEAQTTANINMIESDNAAEVRSAAEQAVDEQFSSAISTTAAVNVNMVWSISNASKTISLSGASGGSFTITAHKSGGYFTEPHLGMVAEAGPEWIIPDNGSAESAAMLMEAASSILGEGREQSISSSHGPNGYDESGGEEKKSSKIIQLNINGNGTINARGMSKEQVVAILEENIRPVLLDIVATEDAEEGLLAYEY